MHDDYRWWLVIKIDLWWLLIDNDEEWLWFLIMMLESLRWLVHGDFGWRLIDDDWLRSWLIITENDQSLFTMIIIDDLHNYFNFDNYHDGWLIGDHMIMIADRDYHLCWLIHVDCYWLIDYEDKHDWWFIDGNLSWMMTNNNDQRWFIVVDYDRPLMMTDYQFVWLIDWLKDHEKIMKTRHVMMPKVSGLYRPTGLSFQIE